MKLIVLAAPGPLRDRLVDAARGIGSEDVRLADDWSGLVKSVATGKPDAMVLSYASLAQRGPAALHAADVTLGALDIPAVIVLSAGEADQRAEIESSTRFEHFLIPPFDTDQFDRVLQFATDFAGEGNAVPGSVAADRHTGAGTEPPAEGFVRERTPKATPAFGVSSLPLGEDDDESDESAPEDRSAEGDAKRDEPKGEWADEPSSTHGGSPNPQDETVSEEAERPAAGRDELETAPGTLDAAPGGAAAAFFGNSLVDSALIALSDVDTREVDAVEPRDDHGRIPSGTVDEPIALGSESGAAIRVPDPEPERDPRAPLAPPPPDRAPTPMAAEPTVGRDADAPDPSPSRDAAVGVSSTADAQRADAEDGVTSGSQPTIVLDRAEVRAADSGSGDGTHDSPFALGSQSGGFPTQPAPSPDRAPTTGAEPDRAEPTSSPGARSESGASAATNQPASMFPESSGSGSGAATRPEPSEDSGLWTGSSASIRLPRPEPGLPQLTLEMPNPNSGDLAETPAAQVLITLAMARATGELVLSTSSLERKVVLLDGEPGTPLDKPAAEDESKLLSTFMWSSGTYEFHASDVPAGRFHSFGDPMALVMRGMERHLGLNEIATALGQYLKKYPVQTDHIRRFRRVGGLEKLPKFLRAADGQQSLEALIAGSGIDTEHLLRLAYFAWLAGSVVFADAPITGPIPVDFHIPRIVQRAAPAAAHNRIPHHPSQPNGTAAAASGPAGSPNRPTGSGDRPSAPRPTSAAGARPVASSGRRAAVESGARPSADAGASPLEQLREQWEKMSTQSPYGVFDLEPGCGADAANTRFYELVREYHPDRHATQQDPQIQALAEKIFLHIRSLHTQIVSQERGGGPVPADPFEMSGDSGVQRRRRRAAAMSGASPRSSTDPGGAPRDDGFTSGENSGVHVRAGQGRRVHDVLDHGPPRPDFGDSGGFGSAPTTGVRHSAYRGMSAEQAMRNARAATEQGNFGKAMELLQIARSRGGTGLILEAYSTFLAYTQEYIAPAETIDNLDATAESADDPLVKAAILTLAGHACRMEELNKEAVEYYQRATKAAPESESAARWLRYLRRRMKEEDGKKPFSSSFLNKLFTPKAK